MTFLRWGVGRENQLRICYHYKNILQKKKGGKIMIFSVKQKLREIIPDGNLDLNKDPKCQKKV